MPTDFMAAMTAAMASLLASSASRAVLASRMTESVSTATSGDGASPSPETDDAGPAANRRPSDGGKGGGYGCDCKDDKGLDMKISVSAVPSAFAYGA